MALAKIAIRGFIAGPCGTRSVPAMPSGFKILGDAVRLILRLQHEFSKWHVNALSSM